MKVYVATLYHWNDDYKNRYDDDDWNEKQIFSSREKAVLWLNECVQDAVDDYFGGEEEEKMKDCVSIIAEYKKEKTLVPQEQIDQWLPGYYVSHKITCEIMEMEVH